MSDLLICLQVMWTFIKNKPNYIIIEGVPREKRKTHTFFSGIECAY